MKLKILLVNNFHYLRGGDCRYTFDLANLLRANGHEVVHFSMQHLQNNPYEYSEYFIKNIDYSQALKQKNLKNVMNVLRTSFWNLESQEKLSRLLEKFQPDIVHLQNILHHITPSIIPVLRRMGIPVVHHLHDYNLICPDIYLLHRGQICEKCFHGRFYHCILQRCKKDSLPASVLAAGQRYFHLLRKVYRGVSWYISPTEFARQKFREAGFFAMDRIVTIPHFVRAESVVSDLEGNDLQGAVFAGRLIPEKGLSTLLEAAAVVPEIPIWIYGDGPLRETLEESIAARKLSNVRMMGWQPQEAIFEAFKKACCVVMPSEWYETAGLAILEAATIGRAAIVSGNTAMAEFISHGVNGMVFEMGNAAKLAHCLKQICSNPDVAKSMGRKAREHVETEYSAHQHYRRIFDLYRHAIENK